MFKPAGHLRWKRCSHAYDLSLLVAATNELLRHNCCNKQYTYLAMRPVSWKWKWKSHRLSLSCQTVLIKNSLHYKWWTYKRTAECWMFTHRVSHKIYRGILRSTKNEQTHLDTLERQVYCCCQMCISPFPWTLGKYWFWCIRKVLKTNFCMSYSRGLWAICNLLHSISENTNIFCISKRSVSGSGCPWIQVQAIPTWFYVARPKWH